MGQRRRFSGREIFRVVRPTSVSLNSLAKILREASPLYEECCRIINDLGEVPVPAMVGDLAGDEKRWTEVSASNDAASIHRIALELERKPFM
jgi:hypothetical protein